MAGEETPPPAPPALEAQPPTGAEPEPEVRPPSEPKSLEPAPTPDEAVKATEEAAKRGQLILERFQRQIESSGISQELSTQVGMEPKFEVPEDFNLRGQLTTVRHFDIAKRENSVAAYVKTWEKGKPVGRLRVRDENLKIQDRIEPDTEIIIVVDAPAKRVTKQIRGKNREILYVKVQYKDAQGNTKEGYAALDYLVSPYDRAKAQDGVEAKKGAAPTGAPAAKPEANPSVIPEQSLKSNSDQAVGGGAVPGVHHAGGNGDKAGAAGSGSGANVNGGETRETSTSPPEPSSGPEKKEAVPIAQGDRIRVLSQARDAVFRGFAGQSVKLQFLENERVVRQDYLFHISDVMPLEEGKKIETPPPPERHQNTELHTLKDIVVIHLSGTAETVWVSPGVQIEIETPDFIRTNSAETFVKVYVGKEIKGAVSCRPINTPSGVIKGELLNIRGFPEGSSFNWSVIGLRKPIPENERIAGSFLKAVQRGERPTLSVQDNKRFYRLEEDRGSLKEDEMVYVLPGQDIREESGSIDVMTRDGREFTIPRDSLEDDPVLYTGYSFDKGTQEIMKFKADRWIGFREQLKNAKRSPNYLPDINQDDIKVLAEDVTFNNGTNLKKNTLVRIIETDQIGGRIKIETSIGQSGWIKQEIVEETNDYSKNKFIVAVMEMAQRKLS